MSHHNWKFIWIVTLIMTFSGASISANEQSVVPGRSKLPSGPGMGEIIIKWVDIAHAEISKRILNTAQRFDAFFGDERVEEEKQDSQINITTSVTLTEDQKPEYTFPVSINLTFPRLENKLQLITDTILKESEEGAEEGDKDQTKATDITVSLRYKMLEKARQWISLDSGVKIQSDKIDLDSLEPFVKFRVKGTSDFDPWALRVTQFISWFENEGLSAISRLDLERRIRNNVFFRISSKARWSENEDGIQLAQALLLRQRLSHNRAIGLEVIGEGHTSPMAMVDQYKAKLTYRRRIYKDWVFFAVEPEARFFREDNFKWSPLLMFNLEVTFGKITQ